MKQVTYQEITDACRGKPYTMDLVGEAAKIVHEVVNWGIDAHLEACYFGSRDMYAWQNGRLLCSVSPTSLPVLIRRLTEYPYPEDSEEVTLAADILETLGIDVETGCFEVVKSVQA